MLETPSLQLCMRSAHAMSSKNGTSSVFLSHCECHYDVAVRHRRLAMLLWHVQPKLVLSPASPISAAGLREMDKHNQKSHSLEKAMVHR